MTTLKNIFACHYATESLNNCSLGHHFIIFTKFRNLTTTGQVPQEVVLIIFIETTTTKENVLFPTLR